MLRPGTYALVARWAGTRRLPVEPTAFLDAEVTDAALVVGTGCAGGDHRFRCSAAELEAVPPSDRVYLPAGCSMAVVHQWSWIATVLAGPLRVEPLPDGFLLRGAEHAMRYVARAEARNPG